MFYEDIDYAKVRLSKTYIQTKTGNLFFVDTVFYGDGEKIMCVGIEYSPNNSVVMQYKLEDLDLTPIPLGFINIDKVGTAVYAARVPIRKYWRQGLGTGNLHYFTFYSHSMEGFPDVNNLVQTFFNKYPTLEDAFSKVKKDRLIAFHRNWATSKEDVFYRYRHVGNINKGDVSLSKKYSYLTPHLTEVLNEKNI